MKFGRVARLVERDIGPAAGHAPDPLQFAHGDQLAAPNVLERDEPAHLVGIVDGPHVHGQAGQIVAFLRTLAQPAFRPELKAARADGRVALRNAPRRSPESQEVGSALGARTVVMQDSKNDVTTFSGGLEVVP